MRFIVYSASLFSLLISLLLLPGHPVDDSGGVPEPEDSTLLVGLYGRAEYGTVESVFHNESQHFYARVYDPEGNESDTLTMQVAERISFTRAGNVYTLVWLLGENGYQHGHFIFREDLVLLRQQKTGWVIADTLMRQFAFDPQPGLEVVTAGPYHLIGFTNEGAYSGGNFEHGIAYLPVRNGRFRPGAGHSEFTQADNTGSGLCTPDESDPERECDCEYTEGSLQVKYEPLYDLLIYTFTNHHAVITGKTCQDTNRFTTLKKFAVNDTMEWEVLDCITTGHRTDTLKNLSLRDLIRHH